MRKLQFVLAMLLVPASSAAPAGSSSEAPPAAPLSDAEREQFLAEADVVATHDAPGGTTGSQRATLRRGDLMHDADIQSIDEAKPEEDLSGGAELDFRDSYRNNVAAYRLDRLLGLGMVPVTVVRDYGGKRAAYTWWLDDLLMTDTERYKEKKEPPDAESWNQQMYVVRLFDQLIFNFDRNLGNLLIDRQWRLWMIDHTRAFKIFKNLRDERNLSDTCDKDLLAALRRLEKATLEAKMEGLLTGSQIDGLLGRRDRIVRFYDERIKKRGEESVLYRLPPRSQAAAPQP